MTKPSAILITPVVALRTVPEADRQAVRRFLFQLIRGLDEKHDRRWRRLWSRLWGAEAGEVVHLETVVDRSGPYHRHHMGLEQRLFDSQERWGKLEHLRNWLKTGAGWGDYTLLPNGRMKFVPRSTAYEYCSDDEMREVHESMVAFLRTAYAQRHLWPHLKANQRADMLESIVEPHERDH